MYNLPIWFNFSFIRTLSIASYYLVQHWLKYIIIMFPLREPPAHLVPILWEKYYNIVIYRTVSVNVIIGLSGRCVWSELSVISEVAREGAERQNISLSLSTCLSPSSQSVSQSAPSLCFAGAAQASAVESNPKLRRREGGPQFWEKLKPVQLWSVWLTDSQTQSGSLERAEALWN